MKTLKIYFIILFTAFAASMFAQLGDCTGALLLESKENVNFTFLGDENQLIDNLTPLCDGAGELFNTDDHLLTHWFTWTIEESGTLYFTLSKQQEFYDLDFILYKSAASGDPCANKEAIRCMYSGANSTGGGMIDNECSMETGINPTETDLFENAGCIDGSNNFLQQINAEAGEEYKLLVMDFDNVEGENTLLELCGTATLGINDSSCLSLDTEELIQKDRFTIFPNPSNEQLFVAHNNIPVNINFSYIIMDQVGRIVIREKSDSNSFLKSIDTHYLQPGIYFIAINNGENRSVHKFVKQ